jgi:hypothetical protein
VFSCGSISNACGVFTFPNVQRKGPYCDMYDVNGTLFSTIILQNLFRSSQLSVLNCGMHRRSLGISGDSLRR